MSNLFWPLPVTEWETAPAVAETPEIKLFGKWSTDDVQINDISLQVTFNQHAKNKKWIEIPYFLFKKNKARLESRVDID